MFRSFLPSHSFRSILASRSFRSPTATSDSSRQKPLEWIDFRAAYQYGPFLRS